MGKKYIDNRGWKYQVMSGLGENAFKARYQRPEKNGDIGWKGLAAVPWRGSRRSGDMDYKELIEQLRNVFYGDGYELERSVCESAADAIEILLAERDAAIKPLHGVCGECKHHGSGLSSFPCGACSIRGTGLIDRWKWRGLQKEGGGHA